MPSWDGGPKVGVVTTDEDAFIFGTPFHHDQTAGRWGQFCFQPISLLSELGKVRTGLHTYVHGVSTLDGQEEIIFLEGVVVGEGHKINLQ